MQRTIGPSADAVPGDGDPPRLHGALPRERLAVVAGKFSVWDVSAAGR